MILDLYRLASTLESSPELTSTLMPVWLVRDAALSAASLMIALAGVMGWFILRHWLAVAEGDQREVLGIENTTRKLGRKKDE